MDFAVARKALIQDGWTREDSYAVLSLAVNTGPQVAACGCKVKYAGLVNGHQSFSYDNASCVFKEAGSMTSDNSDDWRLELLQPVHGAWLNADDPVNAIRTWDTVVIQAANTALLGELDRRGRAAMISARKRAIERAPWTDAKGRAMWVRLELSSKSYSEDNGFLHRSEFTYKVTRAYVGG